MPSEPIAVTLLVIDVFERLGVNYVIGGSLASARHGLVRATMGSDLVADLELEHVHPFVYELKAIPQKSPGLFVSGIPIPDTHTGHGSGIGIPEPVT